MAFGIRHLALSVVALLAAVPAFAQQPAPAQPPPPPPVSQPQPIGPFVIDIRGSFPRHKQDPSVASELGVQPGNLPTRTYGLQGGVHVYPLHTRHVTFGFGAHVVIARGSETPASDPGALPNPTVERHFRAFAPEVSFNFGHRNGWSYISGGIARTNLYVNRTDAPDVVAEPRQAFHYGAGARWFTHHRIAVSLEVRWYSVAPQTAGTSTVAEPRTTLMVLSGGIALR